MENITFNLFMIMSIPDNLLLFCLGLGLAGIKLPPFRELIAAAVVNALFSFAVRSMPLAPGAHLIFQVPFIILSLIFICKIPAVYSTIAAFLGLIFLFIIQAFMSFLITGVTGISFSTFLSTPKLHLALSIPSLLACLLFVLIINKWEVVLLDLQALMEKGKDEGLQSEKN